MHAFSLTGVSEEAIAAKMAQAGGAGFEQSVALALVALQAGEQKAFKTFKPAVRAVAGWRHGGQLGGTLQTHAPYRAPHPEPRPEPHALMQLPPSYRL